MTQENSKNWEQIVESIIKYTGNQQVPYIEVFNKNWIANILGDVAEINNVEKKFAEFQNKKGLDVLTFVRAFLNILSHDEDETLYLTIALIDLFRTICDTNGLEAYAKSNDVLNYIVENFLNNTCKPHTIPTKILPASNKQAKERFKVRDIDIFAPVVFGNTQEGLKRLVDSKIVSDCKSHSTAIKRACFAQKLEKIFTIDMLDDSISIYNLNCELERKITPKSAKDTKDIVILDFDWSNYHQRLGATMKNFTLIFWEFQDDFKYERIISIANYVQDIQTRIWYIEFANCWITTSRSHILHVWDMEKEVKIADLSTPLIHSNIIDIVPIEVLKLIAVSSMDKLITIWSLQERRLVITLDMSAGGIHSMLWSASYQVLITAGYENLIKIWNIDPVYHDISLAGKLKGHMGMLYAVEAIQKTPMVVSCDDLGHFKVWDIRNLSCVQTIKLDAKLTISRILNLYEYGKLAFIGKRLNMIEFEKELTLSSKVKAKESAWPIKADYDFTNDQLVVCTRKDIRFIDLQNGRIKKVFTGLLKHEESEIGVFKLLQQGTRFLLGDDRGNINIYNTSTGEKIRELISHSNEVTSLEVDYFNNLVISSGVDSLINIQKEGKVNYEMKRSIKNVNFNKGVSFMEVSVYHSLILTMGNNNSIFVWDYEYAKLLASIQGSRDSELTTVYVFNHYPLIVVADTSGKVHFLSFKRRDNVNITFKKIAEIDFNGENQHTFVTKAIAEIYQRDSQEKSKVPVLYLSTNKGEIRIYDIQSLILQAEIQYLPHANTKPNYNCNRILDEDFLKAIHNYKLYTFYLDSLEETRAPVSKKSGIFDLVTPELIRDFKAHDDTLTALSIIHIPDKKLISTSIDSFVKIWSLEGNLLGSMSINHPLPMSWEMKVNDSQKYKKKIFYALKVLDGILIKSKATMFLDEEKKISINNFIKQFYGPPAPEINVRFTRDVKKKTAIPLPKVKSIDVAKARKERILTMEDEYSPEALKLNKTMYSLEPKYNGPSLKQQAVLRRINESSQRSVQVAAKEENQIQKQLEREQERNAEDEKQNREFYQFLLGETKSGEDEPQKTSLFKKNLGKKIR